MKRWKIIMVLMLMTSWAIAQDTIKEHKEMSPNKTDEKTYCAALVTGTMVVTVNGKKITAPVKLNDGSKLNIDGALVRKDGSLTYLHSGQCINVTGAMEMDKKTGKRSKGNMDLPEDAAQSDASGQ